MENSDYNFILLNTARVEKERWGWKHVSSPFARLYLPDTPGAKIITQKRTVKLTPDNLYLVPSYMFHRYDCDNPFIINYIIIYNESDVFSRYSFPFELQATPLDVLLVRRLLELNPNMALENPDPDDYDNIDYLKARLSRRRLTERKVDIETRAILQLLAMRFMSLATPKVNECDERIVMAIKYVNDNIKKEIYIDEMANCCSMQKDYFVRQFKKALGCNPLYYITRKKIEKAQLLLLTCDEPVKNIAYELGYDNVPYFHSLFKKITGLSPTEYRNSPLKATGDENS
jgi:AraC-like DNA-binding protein